ncbi:hypothetical protein [Halorubellus litoreus]|uniref:Uncharacterized protein n=1 Tax=Halorubellus litoreus TaxID=755308 RepID=A0ABD5VJY6_9EURY
MAEIRAELESLGKDINTEINIRDGDLDRALAKKKALARDTVSRHTQYVRQVGGGGGGGGRGGLSIPALPEYDPANFLTKAPGTGFGMSMSTVVRQRKLFENIVNGVRGKLKGKSPLDLLDLGLDGMRGGIKKLIPTYHQFIQLIAMLLPMVVALSVELAGLAAAAGAVAVAGGAMIGLGLLGDGDTLAESFANARRKLGDFKRELFSVIQPVAKLFAPISDRLLAGTLVDLSGLMENVRHLTVFEEAVRDSLRGIVEWVGLVIDTMASLAPHIHQLTQEFGRLIGQGINDFFRWATVEMYENQEVLIDIGQTFAYIIYLIYQLSKAWAGFVSLFKPVFAAMAKVAEFLGGPLLGALLMATVTLFTLGQTVYFAARAWLAYKVLMQSALGLSVAKAMAPAIMAVRTLVVELWGAITAMGTLQAMTLVGLAAVAAGGLAYATLDGKRRNASAPVPGYGGGNTTVNYNFEVNGRLSKQEQSMITRKITSVHNRIGAVDNARSL